MRNQICCFILFSIGAGTLILARIAALVELDIKKVVALSTLSQLGLIVVLLRRGLSSICFLHVVTHALRKAFFFIVVGTLIHLNSDFQDLRKIAKHAGADPLYFILCLAAICLCGLPNLIVFYSKDLALEMALMSSNSLAAIVLIYTRFGLTAAYTARLLVLTLRSPRQSNYHTLFSLESMRSHFFSTTSIFLGAIGPLACLSRGRFLLSERDRVFCWSRHKLVLGVFLLVIGLGGFIRGARARRGRQRRIIETVRGKIWGLSSMSPNFLKRKLEILRKKGTLKLDRFSYPSVLWSSSFRSWGVRSLR